MNKSGKIIMISGRLGSYNMNVNCEKLRSRLEGTESLESIYEEYMEGINKGDYE
jgi:hypothetical protein